MLCLGLSLSVTLCAMVPATEGKRDAFTLIYTRLLYTFLAVLGSSTGENINTILNAIVSQEQNSDESNFIC